MKKQEEETHVKAMKYHMMKSKKYDNYQNERPRTFVPSLLRTHPRREINKKFILNESTTDRRIKISSMAKRLNQKAPSIGEIRNYGTYMILKDAQDKKNSIQSLMDKNNLMITA